jgi:hypothetical protein
MLVLEPQVFRENSVRPSVVQSIRSSGRSQHKPIPGRSLVLLTHDGCGGIESKIDYGFHCLSLRPPIARTNTKPKRQVQPRKREISKLLSKILIRLKCRNTYTFCKTNCNELDPRNSGSDRSQCSLGICEV